MHPSGKILFRTLRLRSVRFFCFVAPKKDGTNSKDATNDGKQDRAHNPPQPQTLQGCDPSDTDASAFLFVTQVHGTNKGSHPPCRVERNSRFMPESGVVLSNARQTTSSSVFPFRFFPAPWPACGVFLTNSSSTFSSRTTALKERLRLKRCVIMTLPSGSATWLSTDRMTARAPCRESPAASTHRSTTAVSQVRITFSSAARSLSRLR